jgi:ParB family chromosome partitioning protein
LARTDFRAAAARRLSEDTELSPSIVSLLSPDSPTRSVGVRIVHIERIEPNPEQPRLIFEQEALDELAASIREHGVLQPILVRPLGPNTYQIVAGERRWRASRLAGLETIPALIEDIDDDTALEIAIIENLQREDLTPLDEAAMYARMVHEHGYSIRKLADKLGKDKGYLENRLRLADAPPEIRELVSLRKDSLSHAYELMKVEDPRKRRRLAEQVARGELTLIKLRDKIEGRRTRPGRDTGDVAEADEAVTRVSEVDPTTESAGDREDDGWVATETRPTHPLSDDSLVNAKQSLAEAVDELVGVLGNPEVRGSIGATDRANLAKYLTIAKLRLENAIALVRSEDPGF